MLANGPFPEIRFRPPFATEKYAVVYHGRRLGPPHVEEPANGSVGAVMAQVLGGPRAEAIVRQGETRLLRSVSGTFALPTTTSGLELLQWSDLDNHFVGATTTSLPAGGLAPEQVKLFRVDRAVGSVDAHCSLMPIPRWSGPRCSRRLPSPTDSISAPPSTTRSAYASGSRS